MSSYDYDAVNRLTRALQPDPINPVQQLTESFAYDPVGNRTSSHRATGQLHDAANRLLEDSQFVYTYDANGNLTGKTSRTTGETTTYSYNVENRLTAATRSGMTASYSYGPLGRRIAKTVNGVVTRYVYDSEDILLELDGVNAVVARYTHGPGTDEPLVTLRGGQTFFYHADGLGSVTALTSSTGAVAQSYTYDSFGNLLASPGFVSQPYTYTGRESDPETGLYYYRARYYDPSIGRFLQEDPLGPLAEEGFDSGLTNLYAYVGNNPVNFADPSGLYQRAPDVPPVANPEMETFLRCMDSCTGREFYVTATTNGRHDDPGHAGGTSVDLRPNQTPSKKVFCCAAQCNAAYALDERFKVTRHRTGPHYHFQLRPPSGGGRGDLPERPCPKC